MLVFDQQRNETILIGDDIEIMIVEIRRNKVRLGINAPKHISIHRREIWIEIQQEKKNAPEAKEGEPK